MLSVDDQRRSRCELQNLISSVNSSKKPTRVKRTPKFRFRAIVRTVINNLKWLTEESTADERVSSKQLKLNRETKTLLRIPLEDRTDTERELLSKVMGNLQCFERYPEKVRESLTAAAMFAYFPPGRVLVAEGHPSVAMYFIISGQTSVSRQIYDPGERKFKAVELAVMNAGDSFGEINILHDEPWPTTMTTVTHTEILTVLKEDFQKILEEFLGEQQREITKCLNQFAYFKDWNHRTVVECCILARVVRYSNDELILGENCGDMENSYFIVSGTCRVIHHLQIEYIPRKLFTELRVVEPDVVTEDETFPASYTVRNVEIPKRRRMAEPLVTGLIVDKLLTQLVAELPLPENDSAEPGKTVIEKQIQSHFFQVAELMPGGCFGIGESLDKKFVLSSSHSVTLLCIPKIFLKMHNADLSCRNTKTSVGVIFTRTNFVTLKYVTDNWGTDSNGFRLVITAVKDPKHECRDFRCHQKEFCVHPELLCDGISHCADGSDESLAKCSKNDAGYVLGISLPIFVVLSVSFLLILSALGVLAGLVFCRNRPSAQQNTPSHTQHPLHQLYSGPNGTSQIHVQKANLVPGTTVITPLTVNWVHPVVRGYLVVWALLYCQAEWETPALTEPRVIEYTANKDVGLFPRIFNLAKHANISVNGTCGSRRPEVYCRRPTDKEARKANQCIPTLCDPKRNGIRKAIDGSKDSWISPTLENGLEYEYVTITLDMKQVYQVVYVTVKAGITPLPAAWVLERSIDGVSFSPWQYFAENDAECRRRFGLPATQGKPHFKTDTEVICLINYAKLFYLENGEIHTSLLNGRPGLNSSSEALKNFTLARYVRFRLQRLHKTEKDLLLRKKLFYSIKTISIGGQCLCHGHAAKCTPKKATGLPTCECEHNTCGRNCEECCPLYNQIPWTPGTLESAGKCERCQCNGHSDSCVYDAEVAKGKSSVDVKGSFRGGGVCLHCRNHTTGVNCERCEDGWYRPAGVAPDEPSPCLACECHPRGSSGSCVPDGSQAGKSAGMCECKEGFAGEKCDECSPGWRNFPDCEPCPCDVRGTVNREVCSIPCPCKVNVEGENCDRCRAGFFGLDALNPEGCTKCYCSGVSETCKEANITHHSIEPPLEGWMIADLSTTKAIPPTEDPDSSVLLIGNYELPGVESYYWLAPAAFCGNQMAAYGGMALTFNVGWEAMRGDTSGQPTVGPNVILVGANGVRLGLGEETFQERKGNATLTAPFREEVWYTIPPEVKDIRTRLRRTEYRGASISRDKLLSVLANVRHVMLRAKFHTDQVEGSLLSVRMEPTTDQTPSKLHTLEECTCPSQYAGLNCESCAFSHYKGLNSSFDTPFQCLPCSCNSHADCDHLTGACKKCEHNTRGQQCELCQDGFFGDATAGSVDDCKPCACPLPGPGLCQMLQDELNASMPDEYVCTECPLGHEGIHCEKCEESYFGDPLAIGGSCQPCDCDGAPCDNVTGECLQCSDNTDGFRCQNCMPNTYRLPNSTCVPCDCDERGAEEESCHVETGQCKCRTEYTGRRCSECASGYAFSDGECGNCSCGVGARSEVCDPLTGVCECRSGALPPKCDECEALTYGISSEGCKGCGCHSLGSEHLACDIVTGQCQCKPNITGRACDQCLGQHWGMTFGYGCRPCDCNPLGSISPACDGETGQCFCKPGVGGKQCDSCLPNHYGFSITGCTKCQECKLLGHVCDPDTGRCVCPPHTHGVHCQSCTPDSWGYQILKGCTPCNCDSGGSSATQCDPHTGNCTCRRGFRGTRCDSCDHGYYNFPFCKACDCDYAGTLAETCDPATGMCQCDEGGSCQCKANVMGKKCDVCRNGTFGIQADNPNGCTACFCFGRSALCTQAGLRWSQIRSGRPRTLTIEYDPSPGFKNSVPVNAQEICYINLAVPGGEEVALNGADRGWNVTNNLRTVPGVVEDVKAGVSFLFDAPVYWKLPDQFLGDKVLSYGGFLKFLVETEGGNIQLPPAVISTYPLVQLQGNSKIVLEHFPVLPDRQGRYEVRFHESLWRDKHHPDRKVSRETLMVALQNLQHILIRASDSVDLKKAVLRDVTLDTAATSNGVALAGGVELCECPPEYNSSSCQNPSIGFYRWYDKDVNTATILIQLVGEAKPCECNNRSEICDIETGFCQDCGLNTGGPKCERCKEGYYGDPSTGPCLGCPCPTPERNFAVACHVHGGRDAVCKCRDGYAGRHCDRCAYGWFGYPERDGGFCQPCKCNVYGSVSDECDEKTGQCNCRVDIEGRDCSVCTGRRVLTPKGCSTCENGCAGILLKDLDSLSRLLVSRVNDTLSQVQPPWEDLEEIERKLSAVKKALHDWEDTTRTFDNLIESNIPFEMKATAKNLVHKARVMEDRCSTTKKDAAISRNESESLLDRVRATADDVRMIVDNLKAYSEAKGSVVSDSEALLEAKRLLEQIVNRDFRPLKHQADKILDYCTGVLNKTMHMNERFPEMWELKETMENLREKLEDLEKHMKMVEELTEKRRLGEHQERIKHLKKKLEEIRRRLGEFESVRNEADGLLYEADTHLTELENNVNNISSIRARLANATQILHSKEGLLQNFNPQYKNKYVKPAQMHAGHLARKATELKNLFNATIKDAGIAVEAAKAYQDIIDDLEAAKKAAKEAAESDLMYKVFPPEFDEAVLGRSDVVKALSTRLINKGSAQSQQNTDLRRKLEEEKRVVEEIKETVRETGTADNKLSDELEALENVAVREQVQGAVSRAEDVEGRVDKAGAKAERIRGDVLNKLRTQLRGIAEEKGRGDLENARKKIVGSLAMNRRTSELVNAMNKTFGEAKEPKSVHLLTNVLGDLRNKITEARHAAQSIRLSLSSNSTRGCVRSYQIPGLEPTTATRLVVTMTVDPILANRIIFFFPCAATGDYMALELVDGSIRFVWNNGGGPGVVSKSVIEETKKNGPQWFKIVVERISYVARLWVYAENSKVSDVKPSTKSSSPNFGRFDVGPNDRIWIGGLPRDYERPSEILSLQQGLPGCLHSITLDDRPIGLWSYFTDSTDSCSACETGKEDVADDSSYSFNGRGYSVLKHAPKSIYNRYQFSVALKFRTYDDTSLLFLAVSADKNRYASLILRDGRVIFQIGYGGESQLEMSSTRKYNDGNWTVVEASRNFDRRRKIEKGLLKVGDEMKEAAPPTPPLQSQIPELATADYLVGGFPPGYDFGSLSLRIPKPFLGCLTDLFIDKDIYNPLRGKTNGVGSSCSDKILKTAGFHGKGYLKLGATRLKKDSAFGLALRTLQPNALVLLANGVVHSERGSKDMENEMSNEIEGKLAQGEKKKKKESYYSVSLVDGRVEVRIDAGRGASTLVSQAMCNDGRFHSVSVSKAGRKLELRVDDEFQSASTLPGGAITVKANELYLGGVPDDIDASPYASSVMAFTGTIKDLLFNSELQQFSEPMGFVGVDIGRLGPERTDNMTFAETTKSPPQNHFHCYRSRKYAVDPRAVKFGDSPNSHIQMNLRRRGIFQKNYTIQFRFRTFHPNGVLLVIPGTSKGGKQRNLLLLSLRNGELQLTVKAKKRLEVREEKKVNNGTWHEVSIVRTDRRLTMAINGHEPKRLKLPKRVNLSNALFIGGIPENGIAEPSLWRLQGFTGCMKNWRINNQTEDLIGEKSLHQGVGQCFPNVERGSYFSGDAFVAYKNDFTIESLLKIEVEFRTSEMNGVLLGISNFVGEPTFSLEISNGKIIFIGDINERHKFRLVHEFTSEYVACDNKWHRVHTMYEDRQLIMRVDQADVKLELPEEEFLRSVVSAPLYIGGLPEHVPGSRPVPETRENFKGCMRNIVLGSKRIDFTELNMRHNVLIGSCPANNNH